MSPTELPHLSKFTPDGGVSVAPKVKLISTVGAAKRLFLCPVEHFRNKSSRSKLRNYQKKYRVIAYGPRSQGDSSYSVEGNNCLTKADDLAVVLKALYQGPNFLTRRGFPRLGCL